MPISGSIGHGIGLALISVYNHEGIHRKGKGRICTDLYYFSNLLIKVLLSSLKIKKHRHRKWYAPRQEDNKK